MNLSWKFIPLLFIAHLAITYCIFSWVVKDLKLDEYFTKNSFPPASIDEVKKLSTLMIQYAKNRYFTLCVFHFTGFYFLQTWCIPGTFMFNLLSGSLFGTLDAWIYCVFLNAFGGYSCYFISKHFGKEIMQKEFLRSKAEKISTLVKKHKDDLFYYLTFLRIFPGSPNWLMNITFGHIGIPDSYVFFSIFFGLMPWNFIVCQAGSVLSTIKSKSDILQPQTYIQLFLIAFAFLLPPLVKRIFCKKVAEDMERIKED